MNEGWGGGGIFFFKRQPADGIRRSLVGSERCKRDREEEKSWAKNKEQCSE